MKRILLVLAALSILLGTPLGVPSADFHAKDPGVRGGDPGAGGHLENLTNRQITFFDVGREEFNEEDGPADGLGPRFNFLSCGGCHSQPAIGGTSPEVNPQFNVPDEFPGNDRPSFITLKGPVREARFKFNREGSRDGGVHALYVITGHLDAGDCKITQDDFEAEVARNNVIFRIPTPTFGAGLIEQIPDRAILANQQADASAKLALGIGGRANIQPSGLQRISGDPNRNGNDGTIARFGWKAQVKSLLLFSGEAYNVEMGITNELFQTERDETPNCQYPTVMVPNDVTDTESEPTALSGIENFAFFMRFLAPPMPSPDTPGGADSIDRGRALFGSVGCALCHTPKLQTGNSAVGALQYKDVSLYSDLLVHNMGPGLADDIIQGGAGPDEFRTAPLWGLGQRIFLLHDGRTTDLIVAIREHQSGGSEANKVIKLFEKLSEWEKQDLLNFLRSL